MMPSFDRGKMLKITQRTGAITLVVLAGNWLDESDGSGGGDHTQSRLKTRIWKIRRLGI